MESKMTYALGAPEVEDITVHVTSDGYLIAAERGIFGREFFLHADCEDCDVYTSSVYTAPEFIRRIVAQGTLDQWYADGYEAMRVFDAAARRFHTINDSAN